MSSNDMVNELRDVADQVRLNEKELETLRAENEALKARERGLVEALEKFQPMMQWEDEDGKKWLGGYKERDYLIQIVWPALSAIPEDVRELYRLEREVIETVIAHHSEGWSKLTTDEAVAALQAHKSASREKMSNA